MYYLKHIIAFSVSWKSVLKSIQLSVTNTMVSFSLAAEKNPVNTGKLISVVHCEKKCVQYHHILVYSCYFIESWTQNDMVS